jgi:glycosyltransferase involved in cell wall biosynthesis
MNKLVSIILPTYNGADRISESIKSVLNQTYTNWELLVIDDGSKDNTKEIVENFAKSEPRIKYIKNENNLGIQKTLNKGIREAKGEYIARIDDDDIWCDLKKLEKQVGFLEKNKDYVLVGTGVIVVDESGKELFRYLVPVSDYDIRERILGKNCFVHSSVVFRKAVVLGLGGYGEGSDVRNMEDYDLWHSSQSDDKGYNLSNLSSSKIDRLIEEARLDANTSKRIANYSEFQKIINDEVPAIFLANQNFVYIQSKKIKGFTTKIISSPTCVLMAQSRAQS